MSEPKVVNKFTLAEIGRHNTREDAWLLIHGKVYDVTKFMEDHPGGDDTLLENAGKDATDEFEDIGHSSSAREQLEEFYIGDVEESTTFAVNKPHTEESKTFTSTEHQSSGLGWKLFQICVPLLLLGIAYYVKVSTQGVQTRAV